MLDLLETFIAVTEAGSLNKAAEVLHLTHPAITRQIRSLEAQLDAVLLVRSSHGVTLTPAGVAVLPHAHQALAAAAACRAAARDAAGTRSQRLALATGLMVTLYVLPPVIARFRALYPDVEVTLLPGQHAAAIERLLAYQVDAAVIASDVTAPQIRAIPIFTDPLLLVEAPDSAAVARGQGSQPAGDPSGRGPIQGMGAVHPGFPGAPPVRVPGRAGTVPRSEHSPTTSPSPATASLHLSSRAQRGISESAHTPTPKPAGDSLTLSSLQGATLLVPSPQTGLRRQIEHALATRGVVCPLVEHPTAETIKTAIALGMGVAILPQSVVAEDLHAGRLAAHPFSDWPDAHRTVRVLLRAEGATPPPVQALIRLLQERYA